MKSRTHTKGRLLMHTPLYNEADYTAITAQIRKRWLIVGIPCIILAAVLVASLCVRLEWLTSTCTVLIGVMLIAGYDLFINGVSPTGNLLTAYQAVLINNATGCNYFNDEFKKYYENCQD